ncbi:short-chain dehydrogenase/reductase, partial [Methylobacterium tarhaniae]
GARSPVRRARRSPAPGRGRGPPWRRRNFPEPYAGLVQEVFAAWQQQPPDEVTRSVDVAEAVWRAATDPACPMRLPAGADAVALAGQGA